MRNRVLFAVSLFSLAVPGSVHATIPATERQALIDLYISTDGAGWQNRDNWRNPGDTDFTAPGTECNWHGVVCDWTEAYVEEIELPSNGLAGTIPASIQNLQRLRVIDLRLNDGLSGPIPPEIGSLLELEVLDISDCPSLTGSIPPTLGTLTRLFNLHLHRNQLSGRIPPELGGMVNLRVLALSSNTLVGSIPPELGSLTRLEFLDLSENRLSGRIPPELARLTSLSDLYLSYNDLSGGIPPELGNLTNLNQLILPYNRLSGRIPPELGNLLNLQFLNLSGNRLGGPMPPELDNLVSLSLPGLFLGWNALYSDDPALIDFIDYYHVNSFFEATQTTAPEILRVAKVGGHTMWLTWSEGGCANQNGGYEVYVRETAGSVWRLGGATSTKAEMTFPVTDLSPGTEYLFSVSTYSEPHTSNRNLVISDPSTTVAATTDGVGCTAPEIVVSGRSPWTLTATDGFENYRWSTGETTQSVSVSPTTITWYYVETTAPGSCEEGAAIRLDPYPGPIGELPHQPPLID